MTSRAIIFSRYNKVRRFVREGRVDATRLNKALGIAQAKEPRPYQTTLDSCSCPDKTGVTPTGHRFKAESTTPCKHMLALVLQEVK